MDYDAFKKTIPVATKREVFSVLRNSQPNWTFALQGLVDLYGEDAVLFCAAEAVTSSGFAFYPKDWPQLEGVISQTHPMWGVVRAKVASSVDIEIELSDDEEEQAFVSMLHEINPKHAMDFATTPERIVLLTGSRNPEIAHQVVKGRGYDAVLACELLLKDNSDYNEALWRGLCRYPLIAAQSLVQISAGEALHKWTAVLRARLSELHVFSLVREEIFFGDMPFEPLAGKPELFWKDGTSPLPQTTGFLHAFVESGAEAMWVEPIVKKLKRASFDDLVGIRTNWNAVRSKVTFGPDVDAVTELIAGCDSVESWNRAMDTLLEEPDLRSSLIDEVAVRLYETLPHRKHELIHAVQLTDATHFGLTFDALLDAAQDESTDTFYFELYNVLTDDRTWFEDVSRLLEKRPPGVNEMLIKRHRVGRPLGRLVDVVNHGELFAPYVLHALKYVSGPDDLWDVIEEKVTNWDDQRVVEVVRNRDAFD